MNKFRQFAAVAALLMGVALHAAGQVGQVSPALTPRPTDGRILPPDTTPAPAANTATTPRPDRVERTLPPEIRQKLKEFEAAREAFIRREEQLRKQMDGATTDKEREAIRQRIKENLDQWREQARQFRDDARERAKELMRELPNHREALDDTPKRTPGRPGRPGLD